VSRILIAFGFLICVSASVRADEKSDQDLKALQGDWKVEKLVKGGETAPAEDIANLTFSFKGNELIPSKAPKDSAIIILDPAKKPAAIDLTGNIAKKSVLGIYELNGHSLKLCIAGPKEPRPTEFASPKESKTMYVELKRAAK
jgi:uncharacterized protein (TIGR03067 family)